MSRIEKNAWALKMRRSGLTFKKIGALRNVSPERARQLVASGLRDEQLDAEHAWMLGLTRGTKRALLRAGLCDQNDVLTLIRLRALRPGTFRLIGKLTIGKILQHLKKEKK